MNKARVTAIYMMLSGVCFFVAMLLAKNNYELAIAAGMIWLLNVIIRTSRRNDAA